MYKPLGSDLLSTVQNEKISVPQQGFRYPGEMLYSSSTTPIPSAAHFVPQGVVCLLENSPSLKNDWQMSTVLSCVWWLGPNLVHHVSDCAPLPVCLQPFGTSLDSNSCCTICTAVIAYR